MELMKQLAKMECPHLSLKLFAAERLLMEWPQMDVMVPLVLEHCSFEQGSI